LTIQMKGKKAFHAVIFILLGILFFILFLYIGFPYDTLKRRIIGELEAKTPFLYEIEEVRPYPLSGLTFKNVVIYALVGSKKVKVLGVDRFRVTLSLLPLLWRKVYLRLWGEILGGTVEGEVTKRGDKGELMLVGRDVNLQQVNILRDAVGVEMAGILRGKTAFTLGEGGVYEQSGTAEFTISEAIVSRLPLPGVAPLRVGGVQGRLELKRGNVIIKSLAFSGGDLNGQVLGNIFLNPNFSQCRLNLRITIKPSAEFDPRYRVLLSLLGRQGQKEGFYAFSLKGTLLHPRLVTK
jgi:type II secretion system protein N